MLAALCSRAEIGIGDARDDVLRQHGKPTSIARRGDHEIFLYPKGGRVEIINGKVTDVKGPLPVVDFPSEKTAVPVAAEPVRNEISETPLAALQRRIAPTKPESTANVAPRDAFNPAAMSEELAKQVEKMDTAWGTTPPKLDQHSPLDSVPLFLSGLLLRFTFTIGALKLAFKYWEMDAFWTGIFLIAGIDLVLHAIFALLGPASGGFTTMVAVENGLPGLVMIFTIHRFCFNKRLQNAIVTAAAVKFVVTMCYMFAGMAALNLLYS